MAKQQGLLKSNQKGAKQKADEHKEKIVTKNGAASVAQQASSSASVS